MVVTAVPIATEVIFVAKKAKSPMVVTELPMMSEVIGAR
jgi:hypothetical protein